MLISAFHIDGFGIFNNVACQGLSPQLNIFYGHNEAGKSTCLEFFRVMLTGFPEKRLQQHRSFDPLHGGRPGGSLTLQSEKGQITLIRSTAGFGGLRLYDPSGGALRSDILQELMGSITADIYRRVFGFSLEELQRWDKKSEDSIRNALYGATFGPGLISPGEAIKNLERQKGKLFKPRGSSQPLAAAMNELKEVRHTIRLLQQENSAYDLAMQELARLNDSLARMRQRKNELLDARLDLERRLLNWDQWRQWKTIVNKLAALPEIPKDFPEDAVSRLAAITTNRENREQNLASLESKLKQQEARLASIAIDENILNVLPKLRRLADQKNAYSQACKRLLPLEQTQARAQQELDDILKQLGADWTCERIRKTDRSIFSREDMEKAAAEMNNAILAQQVATNTLAAIARDAEDAQHRLDRCQNELETMPEPTAVLNGEERDNLRNKMTRLEQLKQQAAIQEKNLLFSRRAFVRNLEQTQLFSINSEEPDEKRINALEELLNRKTSAMNVAAELKARLQESEEINGRIKNANGVTDQIRKKIDSLQHSQFTAEDSSREKLEQRVQALRSLRGLYANMENEQERKNYLENRISQEKTPASFKNWAMILFGSAFLVISAAIFVAHWFMGMQQLDFGNGMSLPLNLWAAYIMLLCGVVLFASGFSAHSPTKRHQKEELARLLNRSETCSMHLAELASQSQQLCQIVGIDNFDPIAMDTMEMLLEREKEQIFQENQTKKEIEILEHDLAVNQSELAQLQADLRRNDTAVQQARRKWHALMQSMDFESVPSPESGETLFARAETACLSYENVSDNYKELKELEESINNLESELTAIPLVKEKLAESEYKKPVEEAIIRVLEMCAAADAIRERRKLLMAHLEDSTQMLQRSTSRQEEAALEVEKQQKILDSCKNKWVSCLTNLGLNPELTPETAREAYKKMNDCLETENRRNAAQEEAQLAQAEIRGFREPLKEILQILQMPELKDEDDCIEIIDQLLVSGEAASQEANRREVMQRELMSLEGEKAGLEAAVQRAIQSERDFLTRGNCSTDDELLRMAAIVEEKKNLASRKKDMEENLAEIAGADNLEAFLHSFEEDDEPGLRSRHEQIKKDIVELENDVQATSVKAGAIGERGAALAADDKLADLRLKENILIEKIRNIVEDWSQLALAETLVREARKIFEKERQPEIIQSASRIFAAITGNRWAGLSLNLEDSSLLALSPAGEPVLPINLSRGAQEQAYLSLRLAYIGQHAKTCEPLPLIMDEVLVNFDPERARRTAQAFGELAAANRQQVLYFTCQPGTVDILKNSFDEANVYFVENGTIKAA